MFRSKRTRFSEVEPPPSRDLQTELTSSRCTSPNQKLDSQINLPSLNQMPLQSGFSVPPPPPSQNDSLSPNSRSTSSQPGPSHFLPAASNQNIIEVDPLEDIEIIDAEGKLKVRRGGMKPIEVWNLPEGQRIKLHLNTFHQPVKKSSFTLGKWLATVVKKKDLCPINYESWHKVNELNAEKLIKLVRSKFIYPDIERSDINMLLMIGKKWRQYKYELKAANYDPDCTPEQTIMKVPDGIDPTQWSELVNFWYSEKSELLSQRGKQARESQMHIHVTGSKSLARLRDEFELEHGRQPGKLEWFQATYKRKDGTYVCPESQEFMERAMSLMAERQEGGSSECSDAKEELESEVYSELYGPDKYGRVPGYGVGVSPSVLYGINGRLRSMGHWRSVSDSSGDVERLQEQIDNMKRTNEAMCGRYEDRLQKCEEQIQQLMQQLAGQIDRPVQSDPHDKDDDDDDDDDSDMSGPEDAHSEHGPSSNRRTL